MLAAALLLWIVAAPPTLARSVGDGQLHLTMMDVGQGDAMLVTLPNGRTLMVDAGGVSLNGEFDIGDRVLGPALRARGIGRLDYLAITHGDPDHIGGALSLVRDFAPAEIWYGTYVNNHDRRRCSCSTWRTANGRPGDGCKPAIAWSSAASSCACITRQSRIGSARKSATTTRW